MVVVGVLREGCGGGVPGEQCRRKVWQRGSYRTRGIHNREAQGTVSIAHPVDLGMGSSILCMCGRGSIGPWMNELVIEQWVGNEGWNGVMAVDEGCHMN